MESEVTNSIRKELPQENGYHSVKRMFKGFSDDYVKRIDPGVLVSRGDERNNQIEQLKKLIPLEMGKPYQWGGIGPNSYDCSGLVYTLYGKLGSLCQEYQQRSQPPEPIFHAKIFSMVIWSFLRGMGRM